LTEDRRLAADAPVLADALVLADAIDAECDGLVAVLGRLGS
jgi:hypothetical protein